MEKWIYIKNTEEKYMISDKGRIKSFKYKTPKILKPYYNRKGYEVVDIRSNGIRNNIQVHQLMAICFLGHKRCGMERVIDHIDGNKLNNKLDNLQIVSNGDNTRKQKKRKNATSKYVGVHLFSENVWRSVVQIDKISYRLGLFKTEEEANNARLEFLKSKNRI